MMQITSEVCSELYDIICHMEENLFEKIPEKFYFLAFFSKLLSGIVTAIIEEQ